MSPFCLVLLRYTRRRLKADLIEMVDDMLRQSCLLCSGFAGPLELVGAAEGFAADAPGGPGAGAVEIEHHCLPASQGYSPWRP